MFYFCPSLWANGINAKDYETEFGEQHETVQVNTVRKNYRHGFELEPTELMISLSKIKDYVII